MKPITCKLASIFLIDASIPACRRHKMAKWRNLKQDDQPCHLSLNGSAQPLKNDDRVINRVGTSCSDSHTHRRSLALLATNMNNKRILLMRIRIYKESYISCTPLYYPTGGRLKQLSFGSKLHLESQASVVTSYFLSLSFCNLLYSALRFKLMIQRLLSTCISLCLFYQAENEVLHRQRNAMQSNEIDLLL